MLLSSLFLLPVNDLRVSKDIGAKGTFPRQGSGAHSQVSQTFVPCSFLELGLVSASRRIVHLVKIKVEHYTQSRLKRVRWLGLISAKSKDLFGCLFNRALCIQSMLTLISDLKPSFPAWLCLQSFKCCRDRTRAPLFSTECEAS